MFNQDPCRNRKGPPGSAWGYLYRGTLGAGNTQITGLICRALVALTFIWSAGGGKAAAEQSMTPSERVTSVPKGELRSPYTDFSRFAKEGHKIYLSHDCGSCHGGGGGGGMAPPLTNEVWIYGDADDTLFRLITLGTGSLSPHNAFENEGFVRKGSENVVGPMPPYGEIFKTDTEIWKIIAWIRSANCERRRCP